MRPRELLKINGVLAVGVGLKEVKGEVQRQPCFKVTVRKKTDKSRLKPTDLIPETLFGFKTDVNEIATGISFIDKSTYRPLLGGCRLENSENSVTGTLGCLAKKNDEKIVVLSNWHVMVGNPDFILNSRIQMPTDAL